MKKLFLMMMFFSSISSHAIQKKNRPELEKEQELQILRKDLRKKPSSEQGEKDKRRQLSPKKKEEERKDEFYDDWLFNWVMSPF